MAYTIQQIAAALGAQAFGAVDFSVSGVAEPHSAGPDQLAIAITGPFAAQLASGKARTALIGAETDWQALGLEAAIVVPRGRLALAGVTALMDEKHRQDWPAGIHASAFIDATAQLGKNLTIGPFSAIGAGVKIGDNSVIGAHVSLAAGVEIGAGCLLRDGVRLCPDVVLGERVILHPGVVIGADGFSFSTREPSNVELARRSLGREKLLPPKDPVWHRTHSLGGVRIEDDVEIGANSTVDAGTLRPTRIGAGSKIDNLVQLGHNVTIGKHCLISAQAGVAGSSSIGARTVIGGKAGVADNLTVGADVVLGGGTIVLSDVADGQIMLGYPATPLAKHRSRERALRRLPRQVQALRDGHKTVSKDR